MTLVGESNSNVRTTRPLPSSCCSIRNRFAPFVPFLTSLPFFRHCVTTRVDMKAGRVLIRGGGAGAGFLGRPVRDGAGFCRALGFGDGFRVGFRPGRFLGVAGRFLDGRRAAGAFARRVGLRTRRFRLLATVPLSMRQHGRICQTTRLDTWDMI